jgi:hypothetical protein
MRVASVLEKLYLRVAVATVLVACVIAVPLTADALTAFTG